jgi:ERCC4-type nuclease
MLKNNVPINIIIDGREHKSRVIKSLTGIENVTIRIRQLSMDDYQIDKRLIVDIINVVCEKQ